MTIAVYWNVMQQTNYNQLAKLSQVGHTDLQDCHKCGHASVMQTLSSHMFRSILAAAIQQSTRSLHGNRVAVLQHSQPKYPSVSSYVSRMNTLRVLQKPCSSPLTS